MLQIDHIYEFLYQSLFKDFEFWYLPNGVPELGNINRSNTLLFTSKQIANKKIFFYDQEPVIPLLAQPYMDMFTWDDIYSIDELINLIKTNSVPYGIQIKKENVDQLVSLIKQRTFKNTCRGLHYFCLHVFTMQSIQDHVLCSAWLYRFLNMRSLYQSKTLVLQRLFMIEISTCNL